MPMTYSVGFAPTFGTAKVEQSGALRRAGGDR
jgi:hypothetical protein